MSASARVPPTSCPSARASDRRHQVTVMKQEKMGLSVDKTSGLGRERLAIELQRLQEAEEVRVRLRPRPWS